MDCHGRGAAQISTQTPIKVWETHHVQRIVVQAPNEREARKQVAKAGPMKEAPNPWLDPALTSCVKIDEGGEKAPAM
jgi:hypothetical protein